MRTINITDKQVLVTTTYTEEEIIERDAEGKLIEPKCPDCGVLVNRPKCPWERGGDCGRHPVKSAYLFAKMELSHE